MDRFSSWVGSLEARHLSDLRFAEVSRALRALSSTYVERRGTLREGAALAGAGKRAAFALFYGPLHYLLVREVVLALDASPPPGATLVDLGCGTGAAGAAWAQAFVPSPPLLGIDRSSWALGEAARTYRELGLRARTRLGDATAAAWPSGRAAFLAAFAVNELSHPARDELLRRLLDRAAHGDAVLVIEPLAGFVAPWWGRWRDTMTGAGGHADEWRFKIQLPPIVAKLDRAAGLNHRELTGRSLWIKGNS